MFLIDHDMGLVLNVCDYIYVLDFGTHHRRGHAGRDPRRPAVIAAYLGESASEAHAAIEAAPSPRAPSEASRERPRLPSSSVGD